VRFAEQRLWSTICADFDTRLDQAEAYGLAGEVRKLLERTRRTEVSVWEWKELLDQLTDRISWAEDHAGLGDRRYQQEPVPPRTRATQRADTVFGCPGDLCDRRATGGLLDPKPRCHILAKEMTLLT
jgi:hypothetical protein